MTDDELQRFRDEITEVDRLIFDAVARRIDLVADLKRHKDERGLSFVDADRERQIVEERIAEGRASLSPAGVRSFYAELLALVKRELD